MIGVLVGAVFAASLAAQGGGGAGKPPVAPSTSPDSAAPSCRKGMFRVEFNGNPDNWTELKGCLSSDGVVTWWPDEQRYSIRPYDGVVYEGVPADRWIGCEINDRAVSLWGWKSVDGRLHWRIADQKTHVAATGEKPPSTPPSATPPAVISALPRGGVVASKLQGPTVIASDPAEKAKVQTLMETKGSGAGANTDSAPASESGKPASDCEPKPEKIPLPDLSRGIGLDWWLVAKVVFAAFAVFVGFVLTIAAVVVVARQRRAA